MLQIHSEQAFAVVSTSPVILPDALPSANPFPTSYWPEQYVDDQNRTVVFFDVAHVAQQLVLAGPRLGSMATRLDAAGWLIDGKPYKPRLSDRMHTQRSWIDVSAPSIQRLTITWPDASASADVAPGRAPSFDNRRVLLAITNGFTINQIRDWVTFHVEQHRVDALLLYLTGSDRGIAEDLLARLKKVRGLEVAALIDWPYRRVAPVPSAAPKTIDPGDFSILEHARRRFLQTAAGVIHQNVDELPISLDGRSIFDLLATSPHAAMTYRGRAMTRAGASTSGPPRFSDYRYVDVHRDLARQRWVIDPRRASDRGQWMPHGLLSIDSVRTDAVDYRRFEALAPAAQPTPEQPIDPAIHAIDHDFIAALDLPVTAIYPAVRARGPRETLARLAVLIDAKRRVGTGLIGTRLDGDGALALEYKSSEGIRYAFEFTASADEISLTVRGLDDPSRYSVRKRCGTYGKSLRGHTVFELATWKLPTSPDLMALDAIAHLQRSNTALSTPSPWVPQRSLPSYWWDQRCNFGDLIGPWIVEMLSGRPTHNTIGLPNAGKCLVGAGSLISSLQREGLTIWGSGLIEPISRVTRQRLAARRPQQIHAVRGHRTRAELVDKLGWDVPEVFGDPALLIDRLYTPRPNDGVDAPYSICPHYMHTRAITAHLGPGNTGHVIDVERDAQTVVNEIANSRAVVSTSLHGLIVAQAYGVPWVWLRIEDSRLAGDEFKFEDFFSTVDREAVVARTISLTEPGEVDFAAIANAARLPKNKFDQSALVDGFESAIAGLSDDRPVRHPTTRRVAADR